MKAVKRKFNDLEKKQKEISDKLDKYDYSYNKEQKKVNDINEILDKNNNGNFESCAKIDKDYQKVLDKRLEDIMGKINDNIINQNYIDFYNFLLKGRPKYYKSTKKENGLNQNGGDDDFNKNKNKNKNNKNVNGNKDNNKININKNIQKDEENEENERYEGEFDNINDNDLDDKNLNNSNTNNNLNNNNNLDNNNNMFNNNKAHNNNGNNNSNINNNLNNNIINNDNNNINNNKNMNMNQLKIQSVPKNLNVHISYNGGGNVNLEDIKNQEKLELIHKEQNKFLGNELTVLKCKLNKIRKDNEFLQSLIHEKGMVKNSNVLEKFIGGFIEKLSLNWDDIVNIIIGELIIDEIHELNEIELNKKNYIKNKNKLINNLNNLGVGGIIPDQNDENTNEDLLLGNIEVFKKIINDVKENEKNVKIKYNL